LRRITLDCRHGRALFLSKGEDTEEEEELLPWEPPTGTDRHKEEEEEQYITLTRVYSSEPGAWGELTSTHCEMGFREFSSVLVGRSVFYFLSDSARIPEYDFVRHDLTVFDPPDSQYYDDRFNLMLLEDGGLGVSEALDPHLKTKPGHARFKPFSMGSSNQPVAYSFTWVGLV
jgi:hypothetical protein